MDAEQLATLIGAGGGMLIAVALAYIPGLKQWWDARTGTERRAILAASYVVVGAGLFLPGCTGGPVVVSCDASSVWPVLIAIGSAAIGSQTVYSHLPDERKRGGKEKK